MADQVITEYLPITNPVGMPTAPLAVYWLKSSSDYLTDQTGNGKTLTKQAGTWSFVTDYYLTGLTGAYLTGTDKELRRTDEAFRLAKTNTGTGSGKYTIEVVINQTSSNDGQVLGIGSSGESPQTNYLYRVGNGGGAYYQFNEYASGANISVSYSGMAKVYSEIIYLAFTCDDTGTIRKGYLNGQHLSTVTTTRAEKGTSSNSQIFSVGRDHGGGNNYSGYIYSIRITADTFSDTDVSDAYDALLGDPITLVQPGLLSTDQSNQERGSWEDGVTFPTQQGRVAYSFPNTATGYRLPGDPDQDLAIPRDGVDRGSWEEDYTLLTGGGPDYYAPDFPGIGAGYLLPGDPAQDQVRGRKSNEPASWEDAATYLLSRATPKFDTSTVDVYGAQHFSTGRETHWGGFYYDCRNEPWANPTTNNFTGYARDGYRYTNGVKDSPDDRPPWALEAQSANRSGRADFPFRALFINSQGTSQGELCIFDLDAYDGTASSLHVWMRFKAETGRFLLGVDHGEHRQMRMVNGVLMFAFQQRSSTVGGLQLLDFKNDGSQDALQLMRSDDHWRFPAGRTIVDRNMTGNFTNVLGSGAHIAVSSEYGYRVDAVPADDGGTYIAYCGEDHDPEIIKTNALNEPEYIARIEGDNLGSVNLYDYWYRNVLFDEDQQFWFSVDQTLWRAADYYKDARRLWLFSADTFRKQSRLIPSIVLPHSIRWLVDAKESIYASTDVGIYRINKASMEYYLCFTIKGYGGRGIFNVEGAGELLPGANPQPYKVHKASFHESAYLFVAMFAAAYGDAALASDETISGAGQATIRLLDNKLVNARQFGDGANDLLEDGAYTAIPWYRTP